MRRWKAAFFVSLGLLLSSNLFWLYSAIDAGVTYTYQQVSLENMSKSNQLLGELIVQTGKSYTQNDIVHILRRQYPEAFIVEEPNQIIIGPTSFQFESQKLASVNERRN